MLRKAWWRKSDPKFPEVTCVADELKKRKVYIYHNYECSSRTTGLIRTIGLFGADFFQSGQNRQLVKDLQVF